VDTDGPARGQGWAGLVLWRSGPVLAASVAIVGLAAAVLVPFGLWRPVVAVPVVLAGLAAAAPLARRIPAAPAPAWTTLATLAVAAGHGVWAAATHAEHVVLRRDPGSYALFAQWIATRHRLPVDAHAASFGGAAALIDPAFTVGSPAYYEVLHGGPGHLTATVVPQFLLGAPALYSLGFWIAGWTGLFVAPAIAGAAAVLAAGGLAARLIGPRSAPLAAAALALTQPVLHAARSTYSEPPALLMVLAAAALLADAVVAPARAARGLAAASGLMFGLAGLVRVDALREVVLLFPVAAVLVLRRNPAGAPLVGGALAGTGIAAVPALLLSRPYLEDVASSLLPLLALGVVLGVGSAAAVVIARRRERRAPPEATGADPHPRRAERAAWLAGLGVLGVGLVLAGRPFWQAVRQSPRDPGSKVVAGLQLQQGLPVDGGRTYAEHTMQWVSWYTGPITLAVAWVVLAVLAARSVRWWTGDGANPVPNWLGPAAVGLASTVLTLYRPGITPDHPWADRRLVPVVLPTVVLAATAGVFWMARAAARRWPGRAQAPAVVAAIGSLVLLVPAWIGTAGVATARTELGEPAAGRAVCAALRPGDVVIGVDTRARNEWPQWVRGVCGLPAGSFAGPPDLLPAAVPRVVQRIRAAGGRPVLIAANSASSLSDLGLRPVRVVALRTHEDQRRLTRAPDGVIPLDVDLWMATVPPDQ